MKKYVLIITSLILVFSIYYLNLDKKIYYLSLGDYLTVGDNSNNYQQIVIEHLKSKKIFEKDVIYAKNGDYRIIDLINDIEDNKKFTYNGKKYTLDNALIKADLITISIGMNDLIYDKFFNNNSYDYVDEVIKDLEKLFQLIRQYSKEKIYIFNYYGFNNSELLKYVNNKLERLCNNYDIKIVDISDMQINSIDIKNIDYNLINQKMNKYLKTIY